jgi:RNA polymerase sigma-70 factor (ECF subfamily)
MATLTALPNRASPARRRADDQARDSSRRRLEPERLGDHIEALYRAAYALCGSRDDAEDLVQDTFAHVLKRRRFVRRNHELGYLLRSLRNTYYSRYRTAARHPTTVALPEDMSRSGPEPRFAASEIMQAVASAPAAYRDAVIAIDIIGMSYREAARALRAGEATITTRLHRGRQHIARALTDSGRAG